jgi:hypothetical protein
MSNINNMNNMNKKFNCIKNKAIIKYMRNFIEKTIVTMEYKDNPNTNRIEHKPKFSLMYSILIKGHLYTAYQDPSVWYYNLQNNNAYDDYIIRLISKFCKDAWFNPEKFGITKQLNTDYDAIKELSFNDFEKPIQTEGKLIEETENHIIRTITNDEFNNAFGCVYPYY